MLGSAAVEAPLVSVLMGSRSDWGAMEHAVRTLERLGVPHEARILSAHRTPDALEEYLQDAQERGVEVFIAGAGGAAHLAGVVASRTLRPVLGVPMEGGGLGGLDALLATVQMPGGIPVATFAIGKAGAKNAALFAAAIIARSDEAVREKLVKFREAQSAAVPHAPKRD